MKLFVCFLSIVCLLSCGKKSEIPKPSYSFTNQDLTGQIGGQDWTYKDGKASVTSGSNPSASFFLVISQSNKGCAITTPVGNQVLFSVPARVGLYVLNDSQSSVSYSVTLFNQSPFQNYISTSGAVEILSITNTDFTGRIDARVDDKNFVNGNFKVTICP